MLVHPSISWWVQHWLFIKDTGRSPHRESWSVSTWLCPICSWQVQSPPCPSHPWVRQQDRLSRGEPKNNVVREEFLRPNCFTLSQLSASLLQTLLGTSSPYAFVILYFLYLFLLLWPSVSVLLDFCISGIPPHPRGEAHFLVGLLRPYKIFLFSSSGVEKISRIKLLDGSPTPITYKSIFSLQVFSIWNHNS